MGIPTHYGYTYSLWEYLPGDLLPHSGHTEHRRLRLLQLRSQRLHLGLVGEG